MNAKQIRVNEQIDAQTVRLVDKDGQQVGIVPIGQALEIAEKVGYDLVEVAPNSKPPVCRVMNYGKYKYEASKKVKQSRKKRHVIHIKEIKMRSKISEHDYHFKMKHAEEFLQRGDKVKFTIVLRGREILHMDYGEALMNRITEELKDTAIIESQKRREGNNITIVMAGKS
ncbi:translation initiation factor IF-3 [Candidatus Latescibacterota bacterium]